MAKQLSPGSDRTVTFNRQENTVGHAITATQLEKLRRLNANFAFDT